MKSNALILTVAVLIVAAGGYWYFSGSEDVPLTAIISKNDSQAQFQTLVSELKPVSFNTNIFSQPTFMSLVDLKTDVTPETVGRLDPFAPVAGTNVKNE
jgi:hypothetical protein